VNILEEILEKARRVAQEAEVFHLEQVDTPVRFEANQLTSIDTRERCASSRTAEWGSAQPLT
jgi:hypothetical protein